MAMRKRPPKPSSIGHQGSGSGWTGQFRHLGDGLAVVSGFDLYWEPWLVLRIFFGMAHRVDLIGSHGAAEVAEEWGAPTFPDHPCPVDPSRIAGLGALRDALEMLMR